MQVKPKLLATALAGVALGALLLLNGALSWEFFSISFWQGLVSTVVGALLGIPTALGLDRHFQTRAEGQRRSAVLATVSRALAKNLRLAQQLGTEMQNPEWVPLYPMDVQTLNDAASSMQGAAIEPTIPRAVDHARYEVLHLETKLELVRITVGQPSAADVRIQLRAACVAHVPIVIDAIQHAMQALEQHADTVQPPSGAPSGLQGDSFASASGSFDNA